MRIKKLIAGAMAATLTMTGMGAEPIFAAEAKGVVIPLIYENQSPKTSGFTFWGDDLTEFPTGSYTISEDIYLPMAALPVSDDSAFHSIDISVWSYFEEYDPSGNDVKGFDRDGYNWFFLARGEGETLQARMWEEDSDEPVVAEHVTVKEQGDYFVIQLRDFPLSSDFIQQNDESRTAYTGDLTVEEGNKVRNGIVTSVTSDNIDYYGYIAVNNASYSIDGKLGKTIPFDIPAESEDAYIGNYWGDVGADYIKAETFDNEYILNVEADSVKVKKGKAKKIALTMMTPGSVPEVSIDKGKVANVSFKDGKLVIKGKKKGKAVVTVSLNGVEKTIAVTVK